MIVSLKFNFKIKKNDLNKKTDAKMSKQNDVNWNLRAINKSLAKMKNEKKRIMKNNVNKNTIFAHEIHK